MAHRLSEKATKALKLWDEGCLNHHDRFVEKLRKRYAAYRGELEIKSEAAQWTSKLHPPFVNHIVESTLAGVVDGRLTFRVRPRPRFYEPDEYERVKKGAKAHEILHDAQLKADRFHEKLRPFALQDAVAGLTVAKTHWRRELRRTPQLTVVPDPQAAAAGLFLPRLVEQETDTFAFDGPTTEVVNVEDFYWHESAIDIQRSPVIAHRVWMSFPELKRLEAQGVYKNVDELKDARGQGDEYSAYRTVDGPSRSKDMIAVVEIWWQEEDGVHTVTLGNREVELKEPRKNPFWHSEYPFVVCSTRPDLFAIPGMSQVEKIEHLQTAHWHISNQTNDNLLFLNNAITAVNVGLVADPDACDYEPGARWPVEGPVDEAFKQISPDPSPTQMSIPHLSRLEQQMQNLAGGHPFTSTSEARTVGADTATEAALSTNLAQRATMALKEQLYYAYERIGQQRTELNKQFIRTPLMVEQVGLDSEPELVEIAPYLLQGDFLFDIAPMNESLNRAERKAEANAMLQVAAQIVPLMVPLAQAGAATPLNMDEFVKEWLKANDMDPPDRFFSSKAPPVQLTAGQSAAGQPPMNGGGVTAPQAIDPATSPSSQASLSGEVFLHRIGAQRGGISNT